MSEPKTVPIIDDDHDFVSAIAALLEFSGYPVRSAASGRAGKDPAKRIHPGLGPARRDNDLFLGISPTTANS